MTNARIADRRKEPAEAAFTAEDHGFSVSARAPKAVLLDVLSFAKDTRRQIIGPA